jgi:hypothetical protein
MEKHRSACQAVGVAVMIWACIQEVFSLNLDQDIGCLFYLIIFCSFLLFLQANFSIVPQSYTTTAAFHVLSNSLFTNHPAI